METIFKYVILSIVAIVLSTIFGPWFHHISLKMLNLPGINVVTHSIGGLFTKNFIFWIAIGILPALLYTVKRVAKIKLIIQSLVAFLIIFLSGVILWQLHIYLLNQKTDEFINIPGHHITKTINIEQMHFSLYLLVGFLLGSIICIVVFRRRNTIIV